MLSESIAIVTLFNPEDNIVDNIKSYLCYVKELLIVDNSLIPYDFSELQEEFPLITILSTSQNLGVAKALNMGLNYAHSKGYKWLLTMDQDSYFSSSQIKKFISAFNEIEHEDLAIFSPLYNSNHLQKNQDKIHNTTQLLVMTSGNIINVHYALKIGAFDENLFIDEVDHDFCLRLSEAGYKVIQNNNCYLHHTLGKKHHKKDVNLYSSKRLYYMLRNYLYLRDKHKNSSSYFFKKRNRYLLKFFIKQLIYTEGRKIAHLKMLYLGYKDYKRNYMGYRVAM